MAFVEKPAISIVLGFFLSFLALGAASNYAAEEKASASVVVTGNVFCDTCLEHSLSENGYVISGASVALECSLNRKTMTVSITAETDENGEFKVELPSNIFHSADPLNKCSVKPLRSPYDSCSIPSKSAPSSLTLQSESNGVLTYNAGSFSYRHETVPAKCYSGDFVRMMRGRAMAENVDESSKAIQPTPTIPSLPNFPVPTLPNFGIPPLPNIPLPTIPSLPNAPPLPTLPSIPSLPNAPPLPTIPSLPNAPPLPTIPTLPNAPPLTIPTSVPSLPNIPTLPTFSVPPFPQIPNFQFPPIPFLTPPPPGH